MMTTPESLDVLDSFIVPVEGEETRATKIVCTEELGRAVVATRDFSVVGEVILRERPLLVWESDVDGFGRYLDAFLAAPGEVKSLVLDMHTPPLDSDYMQSLRSTALALGYGRYRALTTDEITKLIGVSNINAHEYYGQPPEAFHEVVSASRRISSGRSALFAYGSKIAHSCCPNATYTSKTADGCLEYKVTAPIKGGDIITFPYIDNNPSVPTHLRREELMSTKAFFCECSLCTGLDFARMHWCPNGGCFGKISCTQPTSVSKLTWTCTECGPVGQDVVNELLRKESKIERKLESLMCKMMLPGGVHQSQAKDLVTEATRTLSNTHFLALKCSSECSRICASHAAGINGAIEMGILHLNSPTPYGSLTSLRLQSAEANLEFVRGCECVAAKCTKGRACLAYQGGDESHPPAYTCNVSVFHSFMDLKEVPPCRWPEGSLSMLSRYVPLCFIQFGTDDHDTKDMEAKLAATAEKKEHSIAAQAPDLKGRGGGGGRTNKKKKGKKGRKRK